MTVAELSSCSRNWVASKIKNILLFSFLQKNIYLLIPGLGTIYFLCFLISGLRPASSSVDRLTEQEAVIAVITLTYFPENLGKPCAFLEPMWIMCLQNPVKGSEQTNGEEIWTWKVSIGSCMSCPEPQFPHL